MNKKMLKEFSKAIMPEEKTITLEELKQFMYADMDWYRVFKDAYNSRKTSWYELGHIKEWRNATDEVLFAVWKQIEDKFQDGHGGEE